MKKAFIAFSCLFLCFISLAFQSNHHDFYSKSDLDKIDYVLDNFHQIRSVNTDSAIYYLNEIILLAEQNELLDKKAEALLNIGVCNYYNGNVEQELAYHQKALSIAEDINNPRIQGAVYNEMAMYYNRQKESKKSVDALKQAYKYCTLANDLPCLATVIRNQGRDFLLEGKVDSAKSRFLASYELKKQLNDTVGIPYALNDLAEVAIQEKDYDLAVSYIQRSSELRKVLQDSFGLAVNTNNIGEIYFLQGDYKTALTYFDESLILARKLNYTGLMQHTMRLVGESHVALGQYENAYSSLQESTALNDSLYSVQKAKALSEMETKYETEKKEQTIEKQADRLRLQRFIGFSVLSSILLIASILYYRVFQKRKYERKIQQLEVQQKIQSERERISRDLHDHVGANLTKIITDLDLLSLQLDKEQAADKVKKVENTRGFTQNTIRTLRDTIWAMNKDGYSVTEFADKVEAFLGYYLEDYVEWNVHRKLDVDRNLRPTQVLNLLRIIQEATQNMLKYSKAKNYDITINSANDVLITIKDDGIGFSLNDKHEDDQYGLYNMEKRANDIEANYKLVTKPTEGVEIQIRL